MDFISNGKASGSIAKTLLASNMDHRLLRPYVVLNDRGEEVGSYVDRLQGGKEVAQQIASNNATLLKDEWIHLDTVVTKAAKPRLAFVGDLRSAGLQLVVPGGMGKTVLQHQNQSDITDAVISMDPNRRSNRDRPEYDLTNLPLPIVHKDFDFSIRDIMASRQGSAPVDTSTAELAARRVAEGVEKLAIGSFGTGYTYGGGAVYGLLNFPSRITHDITAPTATTWTPKQFIRDVIAMREKAYRKFHYGPFNLYVSTAWDNYLDEDYSDSKGTNTLRERVQAIRGINKVETLDYLDETNASYICILVQMTSDVVREVVGMEIMTVQWESNGGFQLNFKVLGILVPQLRADFNGNTGIVHGSVM